MVRVDRLNSWPVGRMRPMGRAKVRDGVAGDKLARGHVDKGRYESIEYRERQGSKGDRRPELVRGPEA